MYFEVFRVHCCHNDYRFTDRAGRPVGVTWTRLASTANAGSTELTLQLAVSWQAGDQVVIATTGHRHSQRENEVRQIASVSPDGLTLTLTEALEYKHLGEEVRLSPAHTLQARAEVGLLSHNVVVRGSDMAAWHDVIEACPDGFDTGECTRS